MLPRRLPIKYHILGHFTVAVAVVLTLSGVVIHLFVAGKVRQNMVEKLAISTTSVKDAVEHGAAVALRTHLESITKVHIDLLQGLENQVRSGLLPRSVAIERGRDMLRQHKVGTQGSILALSSRGVVQAHPDPALVGMDLSAQWVVDRQITLKQGYLEGDWSNPGEEEIRPRALYMLTFEPWDWIVSVSCERGEMALLANDLRLGLQSYRFGHTGYAFIVATNGDIILHPRMRDNVATTADPKIRQVFDRLIENRKGHFSYDWPEPASGENRRKMVFFDTIDSLGWIVASTADEKELFAPLTALGWIICLIVVATLILIVSLSLYLGSMITGPLSRLTEQMRLATEGRVTVCAEEDAPGEIGLVGRHVNGYLAWLRQSNQRILAEMDERSQTEHQLSLYRKAVEHAREGIMITDPDATILTVNRAFSEITGYAPEEAIGRNCRLLQSKRHDQTFYGKLWQTLLATGRWSGEIWNQRKNGEIYPQILNIGAIYDQDASLSHFVAVFHDITEIKRQEEQIVHQAYHDSLTGLPNRRLAHDRIEVSIAHVKRGGTKLAVLFLDLDNFKNVNDTLGHEWGDKLLLHVANRLVATVREEDTVARLGGDEFLILVAAIAGREMVVDLVNRVLRCFASPFNVGGNDLYITASIGVAFYPDDGNDPGVLTKHADIAMYQAKSRGKNRYCLFSADLSERIAYLRQLENNLRQAVAKREFTVLFQPKLDPYTNTVTGGEALVRWRQDDGNLVPPNEFIPLAEETGLIVPLGELVLEAACQLLRTLAVMGLSQLTIAVNLSPLQFVQANLVERILAILARYSIPGDRLELEITETAMMTNLSKTVATLNQLVEAGIAIAIDDFGTGYSSLSYLKRFPIRTLKIDRSFIRDLPNDPSDSQLVSTIILMARNLGIGVVAEGVETIEQLEWLKQCGCEQIQGYVYSRPLTAEGFLDYVTAGRVESGLSAGSRENMQ